MIVKCDVEARELWMQLEELEESHQDTHAKFEVALEHQEHQLELKDDKFEGENLEIQWLGQCVWELEDEGEKLKEEAERTSEAPRRAGSTCGTPGSGSPGGARAAWKGFRPSSTR